jgi:hypothetical protein
VPLADAFGVALGVAVGTADGGYAGSGNAPATGGVPDGVALGAIVLGNDGVTVEGGAGDDVVPIVGVTMLPAVAAGTAPVVVVVFKVSTSASVAGVVRSIVAGAPVPDAVAVGVGDGVGGASCNGNAKTFCAADAFIVLASGNTSRKNFSSSPEIGAVDTTLSTVWGRPSLHSASNTIDAV